MSRLTLNTNKEKGENYMFEHSYENYQNYGKCMVMKNNGLTVKVTVDVGPRIIYFGNDTQNFMWNDLDRVVDKGGEFFDQNFKKGEKWYIYGGHRLWKSPEDLASYNPDNYPVETILGENDVTFFSKEQKTTGLKTGFKINFEEDGVKITHIFKNVSDKVVKCSLWGLSVLKQGGVEIIPVNDDETGLLPNRNFVFWAYSNFTDPRLKIDNEFCTLAQDNKNTNAFKLGMFSKKGISCYLVDGDLFVKRFENVEGEYADYCCNFETYTSENFLEMETLSPLYEINPGEEKTHVEKWTAYFGIGKTKDFDGVKSFIKTL